MKIAVTYENGNVFPHFGHTEAFKVYEVEDGKIMSAEVIGSDGAGHEALAGVLLDKGIEVLICGGIGAGARILAGRVDVLKLETRQTGAQSFRPFMEQSGHQELPKARCVRHNNLCHLALWRLYKAIRQY